jgi:hypothetical protein
MHTAADLVERSVSETLTYYAADQRRRGQSQDPEATAIFETAIIERYRRRESSVEESVSVRRVEDITEVLWGTRVSPSIIMAGGGP